MESRIIRKKRKFRNLVAVQNDVCGHFGVQNMNFEYNAELFRDWFFVNMALILQVFFLCCFDQFGSDFAWRNRRTYFFFSFLCRSPKGSSGSFSSQISGRYDVFEMRLLSRFLTQNACWNLNQGMLIQNLKRWKESAWAPSPPTEEEGGAASSDWIHWRHRIR